MHKLNVPLLVPPTKVDVRNSAPKPVAVPSQFTVLRTLPPGPGVSVLVIYFNENFPIAFDAINKISLLSPPFVVAYPITPRSVAVEK